MKICSVLAVPMLVVITSVADHVENVATHWALDGTVIRVLHKSPYPLSNTASGAEYRSRNPNPSPVILCARNAPSVVRLRACAFQ